VKNNAGVVLLFTDRRSNVSEDYNNNSNTASYIGYCPVMGSS